MKLSQLTELNFFSPKSAGLSLGLLLVIVGVLMAPGVKADIRAAERNGLSTKVNGSKGGRCNSGICRISGGKKSGRNKFLKLRDFDTRGKIKAVEIEIGGTKNVVLGVTSPVGSYINKGIELSSKANLFWLSPGGIHLGAGAGFVNVPKLNLSTARSLKFSGGFFDVFESGATDLAGLNGDPLAGSLGLGGMSHQRDTAADGTVAGIQLEGINIRIDQELFADALDGAVEVRNSNIGVGDEQGAGGRLTLTGERVRLSGTTELSARGAKSGGLIQVGGSWQNSDPSVREAVEASVDSDVVLDASSTDEGDGGEVVVWSDITNTSSLTKVSGQLLAEGGVNGGHGGRIETSGSTLDVDGVRVSSSANQGNAGVWLLDPTDIFIDTGSAPSFKSSLTGGTDVTLATTTCESSSGPPCGSFNAGNGDIFVQEPISWATTNKLTLNAEGNISVDAAISATGGGTLELIAGGGLVKASPSGPGSIDISGSNPGKLVIDQQGNTQFEGTVSGTGGLTKRGTGKLSLTGVKNYEGNTVVNAGTLLSQGSAMSSDISVADGAVFEIYLPS
ncbi:MAG: autotransporter-associated beta strand repeat-containing protein, partial [Cyanobacteriota bacterium]|nr:autotransporter-associated beta strand repeat-containing protein [Cyanobacteriota bacterium]